jgi:outer membrane protein OmpA-like peptidoglycan-associated protein
VKVVLILAVTAALAAATGAFAQEADLDRADGADLDAGRVELDLDAGRVELDLDAHRVGLDLDAFIEDLSGDLYVESSEEEVEINVDADVLFEFGSADLTPAADEVLRRAAEQVAELGTNRGELLVIGHTDAIGSPESNLELSERRAQTVRDRLEGLLDGNFSLVVEGRGETEPIAANTNADGSDNEAGRALNRRVEIRFETG